MSYMHPGTMPAKKKSRAGLVIGLVVAAVFAVCGFGVLVAAVAPDADNGTARSVGTFPTVIPAPAATPAPSKKASPAVKRPVQIDGNDVVLVGEDVPPGTYRTDSSVAGSLCYWKKTTDPEGANIISNGLPTGGRPQVTLVKGQWFTSQRCPNWIKK